jgi:hypothetical protein
MALANEHPQGGVIENRRAAQERGFIPQEHRHCRSALGELKVPMIPNLSAD